MVVYRIVILSNLNPCKSYFTEETPIYGGQDKYTPALADDKFLFSNLCRVVKRRQRHRPLPK